MNRAEQGRAGGSHGDRGRPREADRVTAVTVDGRRLRVAVRPGSGGVPLLVCNGIGTPLEALAPFTSELDPAITVVRFDVPGVGGSPAPLLPYTVPRVAALTGRMMDALGFGRFDVLGISWGGGLAQQLALQNPRRCRRVVLAATSTGSMMIPAHPRVLLHLASPRRHRDPAHAARIAGTIYGGALRRGGRRAGLTARLPVPARRVGGLDQPALAAAHRAADADPGRRRRPDHPPGQRAADGRAAA
jgi:poly(3-hydroxyalkanoate) depolymerase